MNARARWVERKESGLTVVVLVVCWANEAGSVLQYGSELTVAMCSLLFITTDLHLWFYLATWQMQAFGQNYPRKGKDPCRLTKEG